MRLSRFKGLRARLSYANVMATVALFFALTGGAMAGVKYLTATDSITAGDLAGSTYGTPVIANGKITSAKFDSAATAPRASAVGGLNVTTASGSISNILLGPPWYGVDTFTVSCPGDRLAFNPHVTATAGTLQNSRSYRATIYSGTDPDNDTETNDQAYTFLVEFSDYPNSATGTVSCLGSS
jgi:hypothetical protein